MVSESMWMAVRWIRLRLDEGWRQAWRPSGAKGLNLADGALAMAAVRIPMRDVRRLVAAGANPAVHDWLPLRMAAANGDEELAQWLITLSPPSAYALQDALNWATGKRHAAMAALIRDRLAATT